MTIEDGGINGEPVEEKRQISRFVIMDVRVDDRKSRREENSLPIAPAQRHFTDPWPLNMPSLLFASYE